MIDRSHLLNSHTFIAKDETSERAALFKIQRMYESDFHKNCAQRTRELMRITTGSTICDVGSSYCPDLIEIDQILGRAGLVYLCDTSEIALKNYDPSVGSSIVPLHGNFVDAAIPERVCDATRAIRCLQHTENPLTALKKMVASTSVGGRVVVVEPDWSRKQLVIENYFEELNSVLQKQISEIKHSDLSSRVPQWLDELRLVDISSESHTFCIHDPESIEFYSEIDSRLRAGGKESENRELLTAYRESIGLEATELNLTLVIFSATVQ